MTPQQRKLRISASGRVVRFGPLRARFSSSPRARSPVATAPLNETRAKWTLLSLLGRLVLLICKQYAHDLMLCQQLESKWPLWAGWWTSGTASKSPSSPSTANPGVRRSWPVESWSLFAGSKSTTTSFQPSVPVDSCLVSTPSPVQLMLRRSHYNKVISLQLS